MTELSQLDALIESERQAERRGTTRFSRLPGLLAEREALVARLELEAEPQDLALALASRVAPGLGVGVLPLARALRREMKDLLRIPKC